MKIEIRGWKRDHGSKEIVSEDLGEAIRDDDTVDSYAQNKVYVRRLRARASLDPQLRLEERVRISASAQVTMNGRYQFQMYFTKTEIDQLFQIAHAEDSWNEVLDALHEHRQVPEAA